MEMARKPTSTNIVRTQSANSRVNFTFPSVNGTTTYFVFMMKTIGTLVQMRGCRTLLLPIKFFFCLCGLLLLLPALAVVAQGYFKYVLWSPLFSFLAAKAHGTSVNRTYLT
jgi:hypothetical protein